MKAEKEEERPFENTGTDSPETQSALQRDDIDGDDEDEDDDPDSEEALEEDLDNTDFSAG